jgi:serine/threonine protein kinase
MEYLNGGNLEKYLTKHIFLPEYVVRFYSAEIICGLIFLHDQE